MKIQVHSWHQCFSFPEFYKTASVHGCLLLLIQLLHMLEELRLQGYKDSVHACFPCLPLVKNLSDSNTTKGCMKRRSSFSSANCQRLLGEQAQKKIGSPDIASPRFDCVEEGGQYGTSSLQHSVGGWRQCWAEIMTDHVIQCALLLYLSQTSTFGCCWRTETCSESLWSPMFILWWTAAITYSPLWAKPDAIPQLKQSVQMGAMQLSWSWPGPVKWQTLTLTFTVNCDRNTTTWGL